MKISTGHAEREAQLVAELTTSRELLRDARADAQLWKQQYDAAMKILAVLAPPDFTEVFEDRAFKEYLAA